MLFEPLDLGRGKVMKNRIVVPAHSYNLANDDGSPGEPLFEYVRARIEGGAALIVLGETYVPDNLLKSGNAWGASIATKNSVEMYQKISSIARERDCLIVDQLCHPGGQYWPGAARLSRAPSAVAHDSSGGVPQEMTSSEIRFIISKYAEAAEIARESGLDGVEIKADQGKLPHQFLSRRYNTRKDSYGVKEPGSNPRFLMELLERVRVAVGDDLLLGIRLPASTFEPDDLSDAECASNCKLVADSGLVDYLSLNGATNSTPMGYVISHGDLGVPEVTFRRPAQRVRRLVAGKVPIFLAGRIMSAEDAREVLEFDLADGVAMARTHIADPAFARKIQAGEENRIIPCIGCNQSCVGNTWEGNPIRCIHNPETGLEFEFVKMTTNLSHLRDSSNSLPPHFLVAGAGPSGLEAARTALEAGARVTLVDECSTVGGSVVKWSLLEERRGFGQIIAHLNSEVSYLAQKTANFALILNTRVDANLVRRIEPDFVLDATGSDTSGFDVSTKGVKITHIGSFQSFRELSKFQEVIIQADHPLLGGIPLAIYLGKAGLKVKVTNVQDFSVGIDFVTHTVTMRTLRDLSNVEIFPFAKPIKVSENEIGVCDLLRQVVTPTDSDILVLANGQTPSTILSKELRTCGISYDSIGDAAGFRGIEFAIRDAHEKVIKLTTRWYALRKQGSWNSYS